DFQRLETAKEEVEAALKELGVLSKELETRNKELETENQRKARELEEARRLQLSMLPKTIPSHPDLEIAVYMKTATEVGGDYYDFHVAEDGTLTAVVGDATGHGLKAGTMVTVAKSLFSSLAREPDIVSTFRAMSASIKAMQLPLLSMCLAMLKIKNGEMKLSSAGIPPALIYRHSTKTVEEVAISGMPLGAMKRFPYRQRGVPLGSGDTILLMTDGFPERMNQKEEMLDYHRAETAFRKAARRSPKEIVDHLVKSCDDWAGGRAQDDDVTFVVIKRTN
ncbi:PP2C family protein-serine/threonine phosphatase, partial [bacterium]|nr:PP2C family protein-serine/threonine phosphatase [bacterium]